MSQNPEPNWIDTHCHLTDDAFGADRAQVITRMATQKVARCITLGVDVASSTLSRNLAYCHPDKIRFCAGIHPHDADRENAEERLAELEALWHDPYCLGVGEIGLDFFRDYSTTAAQERNFRAQLLAAKRLSKKVIIHNRSAANRILEIVDECKFDGIGIFHCFSGDGLLAREVIQRGFYIGVAGNVTYEKSTLIEVIKGVPLDRLMIESDAPWLTPAPNRKERNEPGFVALTGEYLAKALGVGASVMMSQMEANYKQLFSETA